MNAFTRLARTRILPVLVVDDALQGVHVARALADGGIDIAEITLRTAGSLDALAAVATRTDVLVGAGTVLTADQVHAVANAGARFVVSPGFSLAVAEACADARLPYIPGAATATELMTVLERGLEHVKFFPAEILGGAPALSALAAPFPHARFVPTGGIRAAGLATYLALPAVAAVGGTWLAPPATLRAGDYGAVTAAAATAVRAIEET